jgi:ribonuclease-3
MPPRNSSELEEKLTYRFRDPERLRRALTHRSYEEEFSGGSRHDSNEQLEFLGDAILGFVVSESLIQRFPESEEGALSKWKAHLVSSAHLLTVAHTLELGEYLLLGKGEEQCGGRNKNALLADAVEALVAALYCDTGLEPARAFIEAWVIKPIDWEVLRTTDYKSELQEYLQERKTPIPRYVVVREQGPEHRKVFTVQVEIEGHRVARAEGQSKKAAQQAVARIALDLLQGQLKDQLEENAIGPAGNEEN